MEAEPGRARQTLPQGRPEGSRGLGMAGLVVALVGTLAVGAGSFGALNALSGATLSGGSSDPLAVATAWIVVFWVGVAAVVVGLVLSVVAMVKGRGWRWGLAGTIVAAVGLAMIVAPMFLVVVAY